MTNSHRLLLPLLFSVLILAPNNSMGHGSETEGGFPNLYAKILESGSTSAGYFRFSMIWAGRGVGHSLYFRPLSRHETRNSNESAFVLLNEYGEHYGFVEELDPLNATHKISVCVRGPKGCLTWLAKQAYIPAVPCGDNPAQ